MSELRQDPITLAWVVMAAERAQRPHDSLRRPRDERSSQELCPFCEGNESMTPPEVLAFRPDGSGRDRPGWRLRVVPNKYPAFTPEKGELQVREVGPYTSTDGIGLHEVVINSPDHYADLGQATTDDVDLVMRAYIERYVAHEQHPVVQYTLIVANHRREAGASREHPHAQIISTPIIPTTVEAELRGTTRYRREKGRCPYCDIIGYELSLGERVVHADEEYVAIAPFASRVPFECWVLPRQHRSHFEYMDALERFGFARTLRTVLGRLRNALGDPPYNYFIHTTPHNDTTVGLYHWHLEILPKLSVQAGFELGSGMSINTVAPEDAALLLRSAAE